VGGKVLRFQRAKRDRWLLGVCGGLARSQGWNSNLVRLITVILGIVVPGPNVVILIAYIILGATLPESEEF
jgi:phage shock protein PspC (stress-responsive transcriptional regulator)